MAVPSEAAILSAVRGNLSTDTTVAESELPRLLATLELENDWADVSAKKFRSVLVQHGLLMPAPESAAAAGASAAAAGGAGGKKKKKTKADVSVPKSYIDSSVQPPPGIRTEYFDSVKGKGLVSTRPFAEGELLFTEEAYIATPPPEALDQITRGELCAQCFLPISSAPVPLAVKNCAKCKYRFCTTQCYRTAMATHHALLCTGLNEAAKELMELVERQKWQSLHCVARSVARLVGTLTPQYNGQERKAEDLTHEFGSFETVYSRLTSFATVSELERRSRNPGWTTEKASFEPILSTAHAALCTALDPYHPTRTPSPLVHPHKSHLKDLFTPAFFVKLLGRANINMEKFGGLYSLHSFLNHSCSPNVQIRHVPERGILASMKIAALALRPIRQDEELLISYIDPATSLGRRQLLLYRDYCFGPCTCDKCTKELHHLGLVYDPSKHGVKGFLDSVARKTGTDKENKPETDASLEEELRASLGF